MSSDKYVVYGWKENNPELMIDDDWIISKKIKIFYTKNYYNINVPLYGNKLPLNPENNEYDISNKIIDVVRKAYKEFISFCQQYELDEPFLGIHVASDFNYKNKEMVNSYTPIILEKNY